MDDDAFRKVVEEAWEAVPAEWRARVQNVALLVEDEPSETVREAEGLEGGDTLLGIYQGIPAIERGEGYGVGETLPDTITVYRLPTLLEAADLIADDSSLGFEDAIRQIVEETIWHELGHYFGHGEEKLLDREEDQSNRFDT
jgi:predicted Zn-dependent protease with MMP-like domain